MKRLLLASVLALTGCASRPPVYLPPEAGLVAVETDGWSSIFRVYSAFGFSGSCWHAGQGLFVTAAHVSAGESAIFVGGLPAELLAFDAANDLAVLRVRGFTGPRLELGTPAIGVRARARGYSPSAGLPMQTTGTISALDMGGGFVGYDGGIQPGMSGAPVLDDAGRVIGVVSAAHSWNERSPFSPPNSIMGRLCDPKKIGTMLAGLSPDSPAMSLPFPPPPPPAAVPEEPVQ